MALSKSEQAFIEIDKHYPEVKKFYELRSKVLADLEAEHGVGHTFQAPDGRVHHTVRPEWKQVRMEHFDVISTARSAEDRNDLSVKRAKELGFEPRIPA